MSRRRPRRGTSSICGGPWLEGKIGKDIAELDRTIDDQDAYARATRRLIQDLDLDLGEVDDFVRRQPEQQGDEDRRREPERGRKRQPPARSPRPTARPPTAPTTTPRRTATPMPTAR